MPGTCGTNSDDVCQSACCHHASEGSSRCQQLVLAWHRTGDPALQGLDLRKALSPPRTAGMERMAPATGTWWGRQPACWGSQPAASTLSSLTWVRPAGACYPPLPQQFNHELRSSMNVVVHSGVSSTEDCSGLSGPSAPVGVVSVGLLVSDASRRRSCCTGLCQKLCVLVCRLL